MPLCAICIYYAIPLKFEDTVSTKWITDSLLNLMTVYSYEDNYNNNHYY